SGALRARGLEVRLRPSDAVFLPVQGGAIFRTLRALLRAAIADAEGPEIRVALLDRPGKSRGEVTASFAGGGGRRVCPRGCVRGLGAPGVLAGGCADHGEPGPRVP